MREGYTVFTASDRESARVLGTENPLSLALVDYTLGREDGLDVMADLRDLQPGCLRVLMTGNEVFKVAFKTLDAVVEETLAANGLDKSEIDWLIPHQANLRIIEATAKRLQMSMDRVIVTVDRTGNTSSGSVPLALDEAIRSGRVERGQLLLLEAFGGGFTWGSALIKY